MGFHSVHVKVGMCPITLRRVKTLLRIKVNKELSGQSSVMMSDMMIKSGLTMEIDKEKKGYVAFPQTLPLPDEVKDGDP